MSGGRRAFVLVVGLGACAPEDDVDPCVQARDEDADVRVFVVGHRHEVADGESYETFAAAYERHMEGIAGCVVDERANLVVFPASTGLTALTIGARGVGARGAADSSAAMVALRMAYQPQIAAYAARFPEANATELVTLATSDVVRRAIEDTFGGIAREHEAWVVANAALPDATLVFDAGSIATFGDPEVDPSRGAWVADGPRVFARTLVFDPDGMLRGVSDAVFPTERERELLGVSPGELARIAPVDTSFARLGVVGGSDAFGAIVTQRLEELGAELLVQPAAFDGWTIASTEGDWMPDTSTAGGWLQLQRNDGFRHGATSVLVGNLYELIFDGQPHVAAPAGGVEAIAGYVGQRPLPGFAAVGEWAMEDPTADDRKLAFEIAERRARLRRHGEALLPGGAMEGEYADSLVAADLALSREAIEVATAADEVASVAVAPGERAERTPAMVATPGGQLVVAWEEDGRIHATRSTDVAAHFGTAVAMPTTRTQRNPAMCVGNDGTTALVWQEGDPGSERIRIALADEPGDWREPLPVDDGPGPAWEPECGFLDDGRVGVVWTDLRTGTPRVRFAAADPELPMFAASIEVDPSAAESQTQPAIDGTHVVWIDAREGSWDVYHSRWQADAFAPGVRVDGVAEPRTRLHADPEVLDVGTHVVIAWSDLHGGRAQSDIGWVESLDGGATWSAHAAVPGGVDEVGGAESCESDDERLRFCGALSRFRPALAAGPSEIAVVFQDLASRRSAIGLADVGAVDLPLVVDDVGDAAVAASRPQIAFVEGVAVVAWIDAREGWTQVRVRALEEMLVE